MMKTIKIKLVSDLKSRSAAYALIARVLIDLGGREQHVERGALIKAVRAEAEAQGKSLKNLDAAVSSFCALRAADAIVQHNDGTVEQFVSKRLLQTRNVPVIDATPGLNTEVTDEEPMTTFREERSHEQG